MNKLEYKLFYERHLPHIQPPGATFFITYRLVDSIPSHIKYQLRVEADIMSKQIKQISNHQEQTRQAYQIQKKLFGKWDELLDRGSWGPDWLTKPEIGQLLVESLHYRDSKVYDLDSFCIMCNHLHMIFAPLERDDDTYHSLSTILHSLKRHTALEANRLLHREGQFWQHESYDHIVRDAAELLRIRKYVLYNPVKAGLVDSWEKWPLSFSKYG